MNHSELRQKLSNAIKASSLRYWYCVDVFSDHVVVTISKDSKDQLRPLFELLSPLMPEGVPLRVKVKGEEHAQLSTIDAERLGEEVVRMNGHGDSS